MSWDYGTRVERALTQEEDFEEGIERFLSDSEPASGECSLPIDVFTL
jgi:hypothetical protein